MSTLTSNYTLQEFNDYIKEMDKNLHKTYEVKKGTEGISLKGRLGMVCDREQLNDFGKIIFDCTECYLPLFNDEYQKGTENYNNRKNEAIIFIFYAYLALETLNHECDSFDEAIERMAKVLGVTIAERIDIQAIVEYLHYPEVKCEVYSECVYKCLEPLLDDQTEDDFIEEDDI